MKAPRVLVAAALALSTGALGPMATADAATTQPVNGCEDRRVIPSARISGSYVPIAIEASDALPGPADRGRYRVLHFGAGCDDIGGLDGDFVGIRVGDLVVYGGRPQFVEVLETPGEFFFSGRGQIVHKNDYWAPWWVPRTSSVTVDYELTLRDVNDLGPASGGTPADSFTLRVFDRADPNTTLLVVDGQLWGSKLVNRFMACSLGACVPLP